MRAQMAGMMKVVADIVIDMVWLDGTGFGEVMRMISKYVRRIGVAAIGCLMAGQAMAACSQADLTGDWQLYSQGYERGFEPYWSYCSLRVKANGVVDFDGQSFCRNNLGRQVPVWGYMRVVGMSACIYSGYLVSQGIRSNVPRATMNRAKDTLAGAGEFPGGNFVFTAVKP